MQFHFHAEQSLLAMVVGVFIAQRLQLPLIMLFREAVVECILGTMLSRHATSATIKKQTVL
jgi:hypothetical protein